MLLGLALLPRQPFSAGKYFDVGESFRNVGRVSREISHSQFKLTLFGSQCQSWQLTDTDTAVPVTDYGAVSCGSQTDYGSRASLSVN